MTTNPSCKSCGGEVFWGFPRPDDPCFHCDLKIDGSEGKMSERKFFTKEVPMGPYDPIKVIAENVGAPGEVDIRIQIWDDLNGRAVSIPINILSNIRAALSDASAASETYLREVQGYGKVEA